MLSRVFFLSQFLSFDIGQRCSGFYWEATPWVKSSRDPLRSLATLTLSLTDPLPPLFNIHVHLQASGLPSTWSFPLSMLHSEIPSVLSTDQSHSIELPQPFSLAGHLSGSYRSSIQCLVGKPDNRRKAGVPMSFILGTIIARDQHRMAFTILSMQWCGAVLSKPPFRVCPVDPLDDYAGHMGTAQ